MSNRIWYLNFFQTLATIKSSILYFAYTIGKINFFQRFTTIKSITSDIGNCIW